VAPVQCLGAVNYAGLGAAGAVRRVSAADVRLQRCGFREEALRVWGERLALPMGSMPVVCDEQTQKAFSSL